MSQSRRLALLTPVLLFASLVVAIISSLGAPLLPSISAHLHVPLSTAQWSLTVTLLVGAVSSPIMGRLGDGPRRRDTMVAGLAVVTVGGVLAAVASSLALLVAGRALQGIGLGLVPLAMAAARDHLPAERVNPAIALLSVAAAAGVGVGYPVSGLLADGLGLSAAYWFGAAVSGLALLCVLLVVPAKPLHTRATPPLDVTGAVLLGVGLVALLLAIADGESWGWGSPAIIGLFVGAAIALTAWALQQLHTKAPLVDLRLLRRPAVLTGDACGMVLGVALYMYMSGITEFVQTPKSLGYGFSASVVVAGLCLVPLSVASFAASRALPWITARIGPRALLPAGSLAVAVAGVFFALLHTSLWQAFVTMGILGVGIGLTSAAIPGLIVRAIPQSETGSALGFFQVVRYVGYSLGSALTASIVAAHTASGQRLPTESAYSLVWWIAAGICLAAALLAWFLQAHRDASSPPRALAADEVEELEEDAELGPVGLIAH